MILSRLSEYTYRRDNRTWKLPSSFQYKHVQQCVNKSDMNSLYSDVGCIRRFSNALLYLKHGQKILYDYLMIYQFNS